MMMPRRHLQQEKLLMFSWHFMLKKLNMQMEDATILIRLDYQCVRHVQWLVQPLRSRWMNLLRLDPRTWPNLTNLMWKKENTDYCIAGTDTFME